MASVKSQLPIYSNNAAKPVAVSKNLDQNGTPNPLIVQHSDGVNLLTNVVIHSSYGSTPVVMPTAGRYDATPVTLDDGDAGALALTENGYLVVKNRHVEYAEDSTHTTADEGIFSLSVRKDAVSEQITSSVSATGDYAGVLQDKNGSLYVTIADKNGYMNSELHPMCVQIVDTSGSTTEISDYNVGANVAVDAESNHDYVITSGKLFKIKGVFASASGPLKVELKTGLPAGLTSRMTGFTSVANPNLCWDVGALIEVLSTGTEIIRLVRTNFDSEEAFDVYSTIMGNEV